MTGPPLRVLTLLIGIQAMAASLGVGFRMGARLEPAGDVADMLIIGHRGAAGHAPEHTFPSWDLALAMGADYLEQDLQMTADGRLIVMHDDTLDRTARGEGCRGMVIRKTLAQLVDCDVGTWFNERYPDRARADYAGLRIQTLDSVLARYGDRAQFYIETKNPEDAPGMEEALIAALTRHELRPREPGDLRVIVQSFSTESLRRMRALDPDLPLVQLFRSRENSASIRRRLDELVGLVHGIGPDFEDVDEALIAEARRRGFVIHAYTVNEPADMQRMNALGVDGLFTDFPDRLARVLGR